MKTEAEISMVGLQAEYFWLPKGIRKRQARNLSLQKENGSANILMSDICKSVTESTSFI